MITDFSYDPVTAVDESDATGETAEIFADIRQTMNLPLVTSIWRGLAGIEDGLPIAWQLTKPIFESDLTPSSLAQVVKKTSLPELAPLVPGQLSCAGITAAELTQIRVVVDAYNRSNGMNLMALSALIAADSGPGNDAHPGQPASASAPRPGDAAAPSPRIDWPILAPLPTQEQIAANAWQMVRQVNALGASGPDAHVATLWRHLAQWPAFLALTHAAMHPLQTNGDIERAMIRMKDLAHSHGAHLAHFRPAPMTEPVTALDTITAYVTSPVQVIRMVTVGHMLARWLR
jgi:hypothetical protein